MNYCGIELPWMMVLNVHPLTRDRPISNGATVPGAAAPTRGSVPRMCRAWAAAVSTPGTAVVPRIQAAAAGRGEQHLVERAIRSLDHVGGAEFAGEF